MRHIIIHTVPIANNLHHLEHLSHIQRLDLWDVTIDSLEALVCAHACYLSFAIHQTRVCGMQQYSQHVVHLQELLPRLHNLHTLHVNTPGHGGYHMLPFNAVAQSPALRVLELGNHVCLTSTGNYEGALTGLVDSHLNLLKVHSSQTLHRMVCTQSSR